MLEDTRTPHRHIAHIEASARLNALLPACVQLTNAWSCFGPVEVFSIVGMAESLVFTVLSFLYRILLDLREL